MPQIDDARAAELIKSDEGCRVLDTAIMPLAGYVRESDGWWRRGVAGDYRYDPHPFTTAGDGDPYARWDLVAAMWKAAMRHYSGGLCLDRTITGHFPEWSVLCGGANHGEGDTPHRALALALTAAGLLEEACDE